MPFDLAIIGAGSAAIYYLAARMSAGLSQEQQKEYTRKLEKLEKSPDWNDFLKKHVETDDVDFSKTALVGDLGSWYTKNENNYSQQFGRGGDYGINHTRQIISTHPLSSFDNQLTAEAIQDEWNTYFSKPESKFENTKDLFRQSQGYTRREDFHDEWLEIMGKAMARGLDRRWGFCEKIEFDKAVGLFTLTYHDSFDKSVKTIEAREVILAMGGGGYIKPGRGFKMPDEWERNPNIMDLDQFMRFIVTTKKTNLKIVVQGANAAIDGVEQAMRYGHQLNWLARSAPRILAKTLLHHTPKLIDCAEKGKEYNYADSQKSAKLISGVSSTTIEVAQDDKLRVTVQIEHKDGSKSEQKLEDVDVYVYAIGQDPTTATIGVKTLLEKSNIKPEDFQLIYDEGWHFRENNKHASIKDAAIGLRRSFVSDVKSVHNLDILGASSFALASEKHRDKLLYTIYYAIPSVADVRQLGAIRDVMRAYCKILSGVHVDPNNINFLGGSKDEIAAHIAMYYADIPPAVADDLVTFLALVRTRSAYTNGYTQKEIDDIKKALVEIAKFFSEEEGKEWAEALMKAAKVRRAYRLKLERVFQDRDEKASWATVGPRREFL